MGLHETGESGLRGRMLLVDRDTINARDLADAVSGCLIHAPTVEVSAGGRAAAEALRAGRFEIILADLESLRDLAVETEDAVSRLVRLADGALTMVLSEANSVSMAMAALRAGAHDYLSKPITGQTIAARIGELAERHGKTRALAIEQRAHEGMSGFAGFIGCSSAMQFVYEQIGRIAPSTAPVFISGESGTGKDLCAEALHDVGPRAERRLVTVDCAAIPRELMDAELFGVAQGAHTGVHQDRKGAIELADGGTLLLDEIGALDLSLQAKLLRFLQTGAITRLGETCGRSVDVRVICATKLNSMQMIADKVLREDLFYRLHVLPIHLPPLRQRPADIMVLARHFLALCARGSAKAFDGFSQAAEDVLLAHEWPGNVRQLQDLVRRIVLMQEGGTIERGAVEAADHSLAAPLIETSMPTRARPTPVLPMWQQEQRIIEDAIATFNGNISMAAAALEISPSTIYRKRQSWTSAAAGPAA